MNDDDFFVDDIMSNLKERKKKVNSKDKGKRGERDLCKFLTKRFSDKDGFFRVVGSGSHSHQFGMTEQAKEILTGDVVTPKGFKFSIECKYGYKDIDLSSCFDSGSKDLDKFLDQAETDAARVNKSPWLCWKKPRQNWLVFTKDNANATYTMKYRDWTVLSLEELLKQPDTYFFSTS